jgi:hypothetical protein
LKKPGVRVHSLGTVVLLLLVVLTEVLDTDVVDAEVLLTEVLGTVVVEAEVLLTEVLGVVDEVDDDGTPPNALDASETTPTPITNTADLTDLIGPFLPESGGSGSWTNSASRQSKVTFKVRASRRSQEAEILM